MCWDVPKMKMLEREYPELGRLVNRLARLSAFTKEAIESRTISGPVVYTGKDAVRDEYGEIAGMEFDYGIEEFCDPVKRREVATAIIGYMKEDLEE